MSGRSQYEKWIRSAKVLFTLAWVNLAAALIAIQLAWRDDWQAADSTLLAVLVLAWLVLNGSAIAAAIVAECVDTTDRRDRNNESEDPR